MRCPCSLFAVVAALALCGCTVGLDYVRPGVEVPVAFKENGDWKRANADAAPVAEKWWTVFGDTILDDLEEQVMLDNQNLKLAEAQYRSAQALVDTARAGFFPTVGVAASGTRGSAGSASVSSTTSTIYSLSTSAAWEIDLWGRVRRDVERAGAELSASAADLAAARLSTQALLAQTYVQLRATETQVALLQRTIAAYERFLKLTRNRLAAGVASPLDVAQAETQLATAQAQAIDAENLRAQLEHAIAVLVGKAPAAFSLAAAGTLPMAPRVPELIPSSLVENRPDIGAAERRVAAANARIGVAQAAFFPLLDLGGTLGYRNSALAQLFSAPSRFWSLGPALAMTLFDGGARSAAVSQAGAQYDETVASYRQTVLTAFQEVEDNLVAARLLAQSEEVRGRALAAARRSREIAENQYRAGINSALTVITAQSDEFTAEATSILTSSRRLQAIVLLLKNAGGRWSTHQ